MLSREHLRRSSCSIDVVHPVTIGELAQVTSEPRLLAFQREPLEVVWLDSEPSARPGSALRSELHSLQIDLSRQGSHGLVPARAKFAHLASGTKLDVLLRSAVDLLVPLRNLTRPR